MPDILPQPLVDRIVQLLNDKSLAKPLRDSLLHEAAAEGWNVLFPENVARLSKDCIMQRWEALGRQLSNHPDRGRIIRVLESSASGERFHWLD